MADAPPRTVRWKLRRLVQAGEARQAMALADALGWARAAALVKRILDLAQRIRDLRQAFPDEWNDTPFGDKPVRPASLLHRALVCRKAELNSECRVVLGAEVSR